MNFRAPFFRDRVRGGTWSKKDYPHIWLRDTPWWVNKRGTFVLFWSTFFFPENSQKLYKMPTTTKMADISATSMNTRTSLVKTAKARSLIFNLYICVLSIGRLFTTKPRILRLILNSRRVFKNQLYFMVKKSNFVAFFQHNFPYAV